MRKRGFYNKFVKIAATAVATLLFAVSFFGCGASRVADIKKAEKLSDYFEEAKCFVPETRVLDADGYRIKENKYGTVVFYDEDNEQTPYKAYFSAGEKLVSFDGSQWSFYEVFPYENERGRYFAALVMRKNTSDGVKYVYYDGTGEEITVSDRGYFGKDDVTGVIYIGDKYFLVERNGAIKRECDRAAGRISGKYVGSTEKFFYEYVYAGGAGNRGSATGKKCLGIRFYDKETFAVAGTYEYPQTAAAVESFYLGKDKILVQEQYIESPVVSRYSYINSVGEKYTVKTYVVDAADNFKTEKVKYPFVIKEYRYNYLYDEESVNGSVIFRAFPIEEYRLGDSANLTVALSGNGEILARIDALNGESRITSIGGGKWLVEDGTEFKKIVSDDGKTVSEWRYVGGRKGKFNELNGRIYDSDMKTVLFDIYSSPYELYGCYGNAAFLTAEDGVYRFDGEIKKVGDRVIESKGRYLIVGTEEGYVSFADGTKMQQSYDMPIIKEVTLDKDLIQYSLKKGGVPYYRYMLVEHNYEISYQ